MKEIKKKQHYVWKHYLKPWSSNGQIWCKRNNKVFKTSLDNIAQQRFFYKSEPLNDMEVQFLKLFIKNKFHPTAINEMSTLFRVYQITTADNDDYIRKCGIEDFHGVIEKQFEPLLNHLYNKNTTFLSKNTERNQFAFYIGCQYTRTSRMRQNLINSNMQLPKEIRIDIIGKVISLFFANVIGNWIHSYANVELIINNSGDDFLTGDQPVLNTKGNSKFDKTLTKMELYYPITTTLAILIKEGEYNKEKVIDDKQEIEYYNRLITDYSHEQIYSKNKPSLN